MGYRNQRDINNTTTSGAWTLSNLAETSTLDCETSTISGANSIASALGTLITQLGEMGVLSVN